MMAQHLPWSQYCQYCQCIPCCRDVRSLSRATEPRWSCSWSHLLGEGSGTRHLQGPYTTHTIHTLWRLWTVWFTSKLLLISIPAPSQFAGHLHMLPAPASICPVTRNMEQWKVTTCRHMSHVHTKPSPWVCLVGKAFLKPSYLC